MFFLQVSSENVAVRLFFACLKSEAGGCLPTFFLWVFFFFVGKVSDQGSVCQHRVRWEYS